MRSAFKCTKNHNCQFEMPSPAGPIAGRTEQCKRHTMINFCRSREKKGSKRASSAPYFRRGSHSRSHSATATRLASAPARVREQCKRVSRILIDICGIHFPSFSCENNCFSRSASSPASLGEWKTEHCSNSNGMKQLFPIFRAAFGARSSFRNK